MSTKLIMLACVPSDRFSRLAQGLAGLRNTIGQLPRTQDLTVSTSVPWYTHVDTLRP